MNSGTENWLQTPAPPASVAEILGKSTFSLKKKKILFLKWTIFKGFIEFVRILLLFYVFLSWPQGLWDLNSPTRDQTHTPCMGRCSRNHWTAREVPSQPFLILSFLIYKMGTCRVPCSEGPCEGEESRCVTVLCTQ